MSPVELVPVIPLLPLVAMVIILFVTRPLDVAEQRRAGLRPGPSPKGAHDHDGAAGHAATEAHDASHDDAHGGGHGHGVTTTWGMIGSVIAVVAMIGAFALSLAIFIQFYNTASLRQNGYTVQSVELVLVRVTPLCD